MGVGKWEKVVRKYKHPVIEYISPEDEMFQRIAKRDKKPFLSDQCKEIEENNRMGKTRDIVKKTRNTKGTFHAKMGSIKDRNGMDLTEAEDIKKRWQEYGSGLPFLLQEDNPVLIHTSSRKRNVEKQNSCLRRPYKKL